MLQIGIIGSGRMAQCHAGCLQALPGVKLAAAHDPDPQAAAALAAKFSIPRIHDTPSALLADPALTAFLICSPTFSHHAVLSEAMGTGKPVFCEKPLALTLAEAEALVKRQRETKARVLIGYHRRGHPAYAELRRLLAAGELGPVRMARVAYCHPAYRRSHGDWFADHARCGGVTLDMMSHYFDLLNWFFGEPTAVKGAALRLPADLPEPMDFASVTLQFGKILCNAEGSWQRYGRGYDHLEIYGERATASFDWGTDHILIHLPGEERRRSVPAANAYATQMQTFVDMAAGKLEPPCTVEDGWKALKVAVAVTGGKS